MADLFPLSPGNEKEKIKRKNSFVKTIMSSPKSPFSRLSSSSSTTSSNSKLKKVLKKFSRNKDRSGKEEETLSEYENESESERRASSVLEEEIRDAKEEVDNIIHDIHNKIDPPTHAPPPNTKQEETRKEEREPLGKPDPLQGNNEKKRNPLDLVKDEVKSMVGKEEEKPFVNDHQHQLGPTETCGRIVDINEKTTLNEAKESSTLKQAKEELQVNVKGSLDLVKDEVKSVVGKEEEKPLVNDHQHQHHPTETQGRIADINEKTKLNEVKESSTLKQAKKEVEPTVDTTHKQNVGETDNTSPLWPQHDEKKESGCVCSLAEGLQNLCAPWSKKKDD